MFPNLKSRFQLGALWCESNQEVFYDPPWSIRRAGNENVRRLAKVSQQPGCWALSRSPGVHARVLHKAGNRHFQRCGIVAGVSMKNVLLGTLNHRDAPELYASGKEAYKMLKGVVVGGPSLVFCRKHEAGKTRIRSHKFPCTTNQIWLAPFQLKQYCCMPHGWNGILTMVWKSERCIEQLTMCLKRLLSGLWRKSPKTGARLNKILTVCSLRYHVIRWKKQCARSCGRSFKNGKKEWFAWTKWIEREPGMFKLEFEGTSMIALCSKSYYG